MKANAVRDQEQSKKKPGFTIRTQIKAGTAPISNHNESLAKDNNQEQSKKKPGFTIRTQIKAGAPPLSNHNQILVKD